MVKLKDSPLEFVLVDKSNYRKMIEVQNEIFPLENGQDDIKTCVSGRPHYYLGFVEYYLVKRGRNYVGICGVYSYKDYPNDGWLGWFGVRQKYRKNGFGSKILDYCIKKARKMGYKTFRLYTDDVENENAVKLYTKFGMTGEKYTNKKDHHFEVGNTLVFSLSLTGGKVEPWNDRYIFLSEHDISNGIIEK